MATTAFGCAATPRVAIGRGGRPSNPCCDAVVISACQFGDLTKTELDVPVRLTLLNPHRVDPLEQGRTLIDVEHRGFPRLQSGLAGWIVRTAVVQLEPPAVLGLSVDVKVEHDAR